MKSPSDSLATETVMTPEARIALLEKEVGDLSFRCGYLEERNRHVQHIVNDRVMHHREKVLQLRQIVNMEIPSND